MKVSTNPLLKDLELSTNSSLTELLAFLRVESSRKVRIHTSKHLTYKHEPVQLRHWIIGIRLARFNCIVGTPELV